MSNQTPVVHRDPEVLGGTPVFRGTRVPVDALLSNLEAGVSIDEFLENFPTVSREQVIEVLKFSRATLHRLKAVRSKPTRARQISSRRTSAREGPL